MDDVSGFYLKTDGGEEAYIEVALSVLNANAGATLFFLKATMDDIDLQVGVRIFLDIDKEQALKGSVEQKPSEVGRLTFGDLSKINFKDLFTVGLRIAATFSIEKVTFQYNADIFPDEFQFVQDYVPSLEAGIATQAREEFILFPGGRKTKGFQEDEAENGERGRQLQMQLRERSEWLAPEHGAYQLLRSLQSSNLLDPDFEYPLCPIVDEDQIFCGRALRLTLNLGKIAEVILPILEKFANGENTGILDAILDPAIIWMDKPVPGISYLMGAYLAESECSCI